MPYMSASIQFLVSTPMPHPSSFSSAPFASASPYSGIASTSRSSSSSSWSRTSSWTLHSAVAGITLPPISPSHGSSISELSEDAGEPTAQVNCLRASVRFLQDCRLSLIHIPLELYPHFVQAILSLILPESSRDKDGSPVPSELSDDGTVPVLPSPSAPTATDFVNVSITPVECSVVCSKHAAAKFFMPIINTLDPTLRGSVNVSEDDFVAIQVDGEGLDAGQRVLDLTSPLALAGIPILFITTYFSDYIIVPAKNRSHVTKALQRRGFVFEKYSDSFVTTPSHHRNSSSTSSFNIPPPTPPLTTTTIGDLESQTFTTLRNQKVVPQVCKDTKLVLCAGRRLSRKNNSGDDQGLKLGLIKCLVSRPQFMSVTLTDAEPASLLLEKDMLGMFDSDSDILLGSKEDYLIPILLDLRGLPIDSTGIVCGVAGRLVGGTKGGLLDGTDAVEMSYLSTARAGTVMVIEDDIDRAVAVLDM